MASKSRRNKVKFKWTKELIILISCIVAMIVATIVLGIPSKAETRLESYNTGISDYNTANSTSYQTIGEDNVYDETDYEGLAKLVNGTDDYVYVLYGSFSQENFVKYFSEINDKATDYDINKVYLVFSNWVEESDRDSIDFKNEQKNIEAKYSTSTQYDVDKFDITQYPSLLVFYEGKLIFNSNTISSNTSYNTWDVSINEAFTLAYKNSNK